MKPAYLLIIGVLLGFALGWYVYRPVVIHEAKAPEQRLDDGALVLERDAKADAPGASSVPKGTKTERKVRVTVQPDAEGCPACTVDLSLVREPGGAHRVIASSPTGQVISGIDVPVGPTIFHKPQLWAAGVSYGINDETWGGWLDRDVGPFRIGGEALQLESGAIGGRIRFGGRF